MNKSIESTAARRLSIEAKRAIVAERLRERRHAELIEAIKCNMHFDGQLVVRNGGELEIVTIAEFVPMNADNVETIDKFGNKVTIGWDEIVALV